ncbi:MAG: hypothetical protein AAF556_11715 [Pseudomonadota bacterium]
MRDIHLHKTLFGISLLITLILLGLSLAVFDFTMALVLFSVAFAIPLAGVWTMPGERPRPPWLACLLGLCLLLVPLGIFGLDQPTRERAAALIVGLTNNPAISWAWLEQTYKAMPSDTARHPIALPEGSIATTSRNLDLLIMLEEQISQ